MGIVSSYLESLHSQDVETSHTHDTHTITSTKGGNTMQPKEITLQNVVEPFSLSRMPSVFVVMGPRACGKSTWVMKTLVPYLQNCLDIHRVTLFPTTNQTNEHVPETIDVIPPEKQLSMLQKTVRDHITSSNSTQYHDSSSSSWWCTIFDDTHAMKRDVREQIDSLLTMRESLRMIPILITQDFRESPQLLTPMEYTSAHRILIQTRGMEEDRHVIAKHAPKLCDVMDHWIQSRQYAMIIEGCATETPDDPIVRLCTFTQ